MKMTNHWSIEFKPSAFKELKKIDPKVRTQIFRFFDRLTEEYESPRAIGSALQGKHKGLWRYRVGDYRIICEIQDQKLIVLVLAVGHRREIYSSH
jgi:mRNA interferase RelE/StbE